MKKLSIIEQLTGILAGLHLGLTDELTIDFQGQKVEYNGGYQVEAVECLKVERFRIQPLTLDTIKIIMSHLNFHAVGLDDKTYNFNFWYNRENGFLNINLVKKL